MYVAKIVTALRKNRVYRMTWQTVNTETYKQYLLDQKSSWLTSTVGKHFRLWSTGFIIQKYKCFFRLTDVLVCKSDKDETSMAPISPLLFEMVQP